METALLEAKVRLDLQPGLAIQEVEKRLEAARRAGDVGARVLAFYLADMADRRAYAELGYHSVLHFAEVRLGMRQVTTRQYVAIGHALEELSEIDVAFRDGRLCWSQVRLLARVAVPQTERAWVEWAEGRTVREIARHVACREKGQLPSEPARRRIHANRFSVRGRFDSVQLEIWNTARAKLEAMVGEPITDGDLMLRAARLILELRPDGSVPGFVRVNDGHYRVGIVFVEPQDDQPGACVVLRTEDGHVPLLPEEAVDVLRAAGREDLATRLAPTAPSREDDGEDGDAQDVAEVSMSDRDEPTPEELRRRVLTRDGHRCKCCGGRKNLTVHHKRWRRHGGRTDVSNLISLCEDCHALVHDRLLFVRGRIPNEVLFVDRRGRDVRQAGVGRSTTAVAPGAKSRDARASQEGASRRPATSRRRGRANNGASGRTRTA